MHRTCLRRSHAAGNESSQHRRGAAVVEFAVMAPLFLMLVLGVVELGYALDASNTLYGVVREGGRLASQDFSRSLGPGQTANEKVALDIRNMLTAAGIDGSNVTVTIEHADAPGTTFDLQDPDNYLDYFRIRVQVAWENVSTLPGNYLTGRVLAADITFRLGHVTVTQ
jgi:Flp pilus assembly protein TadG